MSIDARILNSMDGGNSPDKLGDRFRTRNGVILKFKRVAPFLVRDALKLCIPPTVPEYYHEGKETWEPNPMHPDYLAAQQEYAVKQADTLMHIYLSLGTEVESCPADVDPVESDAWLETLESVTELKIERTGKARYVSWLLYNVLEDGQELQILASAVMAYNGKISEVDVLEAMRSFRSDSQPTTDSTVASDDEDTHTDRVRSDPGSSAGLRGNGSRKIRTTVDEAVS